MSFDFHDSDDLSRFCFDQMILNIDIFFALIGFPQGNGLVLGFLGLYKLLFNLFSPHKLLYQMALLRTVLQTGSLQSGVRLSLRISLMYHRFS